MKIALGADSAGKPLLDVVMAHLRAKSDHVVNDLSGLGYYAEIADRVASSVQAGEHDRAILFCGTGIGVSIAANKFPASARR
jgi:D-erythrulose 4-phosphate isomerase